MKLEIQYNATKSYLPREAKVLKDNWTETRIKLVPKTRWTLKLQTDSGKTMLIPISPQKALALMKASKYDEVDYTVINYKGE